MNMLQGSLKLEQVRTLLAQYFRKDYGVFNSDADLFRQIGLDERQHKDESLSRIKEARFSASRQAAR
jgi:hypothetical protein